MYRLSSPAARKTLFKANGTVHAAVPSRLAYLTLFFLLAMAATSRTARLTLLSFSLLVVVTSAAGVSSTLGPQWARTSEYIDVCKEVESQISTASDVYYPLSIEYTADLYHWASSSTQTSACSLEPGTAEDIGVILQILGETQTPFAVKGGGHTSNPGFSSTEGVQISMTRFNEVVYDASSSTVEIGTGLIWDDVYAALADDNVNVVGGRVTGVGVAGFTLGGGYSWLTNQYGLTIDTVQAFELVLPNGTVTTVTSASNPDLFFGLRGGFNNFGIVTKFTLSAFAQEQVWGGLIILLGDKLDAVAKATANFNANNTDPKAQIIVELNTLEGLPGVTISVFYDGPDQPQGIFDELLAIEAFSTDLSTRSFLSLVQSAPSNATAGLRAAFHTVSVTDFTPSLLDVIVNETIFWGSNVETLFSSGSFISYDVEPFLPSIFEHGSDSAYPPSRTQGLLPLNLYFAWFLPAADDYFLGAIKQSAATVQAAAIAEGQDIANAALYGNYAVVGTSIDMIYGDNVARLEAIKAQYDPNDIMGLTGGWKIPT
ncbi:hypothetical protein EW145_g6525 [Phellinidium pouzarii]|uniref:FAD-binding PCMH-type domain-containing protein n=1 Tax=Phellinidium pouzarii TaxID=167371 RepID=A0A4S4KWC2_9AGAM|nr:hypothetical protein EW145_g6525 [Phellinidium pouzarii]